MEDDDEYVSDDLDSSDPNISDDEKVPKFEKFKREHFDKNFKFEWDMELNFLGDFREEIREWSVLNGREIIFCEKRELHGKGQMYGQMWIFNTLLKIGPYAHLCYKNHV
ncbi:unnamed protein product [Vicia faba]|uniref:Uncharacterized protein n=1 Tax=Vicia faba TaxID=3906 RepID=A0AAV1AP57_VICFA|nr:unnamed protein product [Vicia faba]